MARQEFIGSIPARISIFSRSPKTIHPNWDTTGTPLVADPITVYPAIVAPADNAKRIETAQHWADGYQGAVPGVTVVDIPNDPFFIRIVDMEYRSEGGRAYKVVFNYRPYKDDAPKFYVDLREDVLLEALLAEGCEREGHLGGSYIWAVLGSQMKVIRCDSTLYYALQATSARKGNAPIKKAGLIIGGVYRRPAGAMVVYLGEYSTLEVDIQRMGNTTWKYFTKRTEKTLCWLELNQHQAADPQKGFDEMHYFAIKFRATPMKVVEHVMTVSVPDSLPRFIHERVMKQIMEYRARDERHFPSYRTNLDQPKEGPEGLKASEASQYSAYLNIGPVGANYVHPSIVAHLLTAEAAGEITVDDD